LTFRKKNCKLKHVHKTIDRVKGEGGNMEKDLTDIGKRLAQGEKLPIVPVPPNQSQSSQLQSSTESHQIQQKQTIKDILIPKGIELTEKEIAELTKPVEPELIRIRPDGLVYVEQVHYRETLNRAFGIGQWTVLPEDIRIDKNKVYFLGHLFVKGVYVASAMGEAEYNDNNPRHSWASAWESAKSDCITRLCKDLGVRKELWDSNFINNWIKENAVRVQVSNKYGEIVYQWRRKDDPPLLGEIRNGNSKEKWTEEQKERFLKFYNWLSDEGEALYNLTKEAIVEKLTSEILGYAKKLNQIKPDEFEKIWAWFTKK